MTVGSLIVALTLATTPVKGGAAPSRHAAAAARAPRAKDTIDAAAREARAALDARLGRAALSSIASRYFDFEELARRSMGRHWARHDQSDRVRLVTALRQLVEETYFSRLDQSASYTFRIDGARGNNSYAAVQATAISGPEAFPLEFRMRRAQDGRWLVYDVAIGGLALLDGYQEQFPQLLEIGGMPKLIATLEEQRQSLRSRPRGSSF